MTVEEYKAICNSITDKDRKLLLEQGSVCTPHKHGHWNCGYEVRCSLCNYKLETTGLPTLCPNCGAKMEVE